MSEIIDESMVEKLKARYSSLHPLVFHRSVEKSKTPGELFDILDSFPKEFPVVWSQESRKWVHTKDLVQVGRFDLEMEKK